MLKGLFDEDFDPKDALFMLGLLLIIGGLITTAAGMIWGLLVVFAGIGIVVLAFRLVKKT